ncbi:MAG TPA: Bax inhibitor-1 family protein [Acidimicrobiales bacterium]|nr:Bax inhibitor-1 family protein [Acidimicrobiales bacterium]
MSQFGYPGGGYVSRAPVSVRGTATLFGTTMELVAGTMGCFALGCYLGRNLAPGLGIVFFIVAFAVLIGMRFTMRASSTVAVALLVVFGVAMGLATGPTVAYYASTSPDAVWEAGGATALFMGGMGVVGFSIRRDMAHAARLALWALLALILFGVVAIFTQIPHADLIYSCLGLAIFAVLTVADFQRLRMGGRGASAPVMAASIFLDALNVFLFFLNIFAGRRN